MLFGHSACWLSGSRSLQLRSLRRQLRQVCKSAQRDVETHQLHVATGHRTSMARLGHMLASGSPAALEHMGGDREAALREAKSWFERAAEKNTNLSSAALGLGTMYLWGNGTAVNHVKAYELLSAVAKADAAEQETSEAKYLLGVMWLNGWGVQERSTLQAQRLFAEAAKVRNKPIFRMGYLPTPRGTKNVMQSPGSQQRDAAFPALPSAVIDHVNVVNVLVMLCNQRTVRRLNTLWPPTTRPS